MKLILSLIVIIALAYASSRIFFSMKRIPLQLRFISLSGIEFILLGYVLGEHLVGLIDDEVLGQMRPAIGLGLAWIGLVFGLQFNWKNMKRLPYAIYTQALGQALFVWIAIFVLHVLIFVKIRNLHELYLIPSLMVIACSAAISSPTLIPLLSRYEGARGRTTRMLEQISSLDAVVGILFLGFVYSIWRVKGSPPVGSAVPVLLFSLAIGIVMAFIFKALCAEMRSDAELLLLSLAMVILSGGVSLYLKLSPLFVNFVFGVTLANIHWRNYRIFKVLAIPEKPIYFMFLILSGAIWHLENWTVLPAAVIYVLLRTGSKVLGNFSMARLTYRGRRRIPGLLGIGLIPQGGIPIAIAISFAQTYTDDFCRTVSSTIILAIVINELIGPVLARYLLRQSGDIT